MAKGTGLIGNFKGKVGNMVGYNLKDSNNKQTQGIRVYQPVVRNPKSYAQAQQRCIMKPINDFYRALKPVISRGQEGKAYGNASRLAWLKNVMKEYNGPWLVKGSTEQWPINCMVTNGSLPTFAAEVTDDGLLQLGRNDAIVAAPVNIGALTTAIKLIYPSLQDGDQITFVRGYKFNDALICSIDSYILDSASVTTVSGFDVQDNILSIKSVSESYGIMFGAVIISRESTNGGHLRSTEVLSISPEISSEDVYQNAATKATAIASYMTAGAKTDWPQEALEG